MYNYCNEEWDNLHNNTYVAELPQLNSPKAAITDSSSRVASINKPEQLDSPHSLQLSLQEHHQNVPSSYSYSESPIPTQQRRNRNHYYSTIASYRVPALSTENPIHSRSAVPTIFPPIISQEWSGTTGSIDCIHPSDHPQFYGNHSNYSMQPSSYQTTLIPISAPFIRHIPLDTTTTTTITTINMNHESVMNNNIYRMSADVQPVTQHHLDSGRNKGTFSTVAVDKNDTNQWTMLKDTMEADTVRLNKSTMSASTSHACSCCPSISWACKSSSNFKRIKNKKQRLSGDTEVRQQQLFQQEQSRRQAKQEEKENGFSSVVRTIAQKQTRSTTTQQRNEIQHSTIGASSSNSMPLIQHSCMTTIGTKRRPSDRRNHQETKGNKQKEKEECNSNAYSAVIHQLEDELAFLWDECESILIMLGSSQNAFQAAHQKEGCSKKERNNVDECSTKETDNTSLVTTTNEAMGVPTAITMNSSHPVFVIQNYNNNKVEATIRSENSTLSSLTQNDLRSSASSIPIPTTRQQQHQYDQDLIQEMRLAYDDLKLQVKHLDKKLEIFEKKSRQMMRMIRGQYEKDKEVN
ncbi:hypothetical protein BDF20DRAFT_839339 [Mycotypha africana]|uniref:uncharacterized protein n=1 Tax=Mycotypha africana TaxID=64632 RepID=UPI00230010A4|nr:uncharacterized protein BDF20DRAFT_839339 [Mycotypha africana]KAI8968215.1 hypothetical protein BDF20DRAFT_839339 [Mycotypha africana]